MTDKAQDQLDHMHPLEGAGFVLAVAVLKDQAKRVAVYPELILCARKVNDSMTQFLLQEMLKMLAKLTLLQPCWA